MTARDDDGVVTRFFAHPLTTVTAGLGFAGQGLGLVDPVGLVTGIVGIVMGSAGQWFTLLGVLKGLGGLVGAIPEGLTTTLFIAGGAAYAAWLAWGLLDRWTDQFNQRFNRNNS